MMINKIRITFRLLKDYIRDVVIGDKILVGLDAQVQWHADDYQELNQYYLSFSKDPVYMERTLRRLANRCCGFGYQRYR